MQNRLVKMFGKLVWINLFLCLTLIQCETGTSREEIMGNIAKYVKFENPSSNTVLYRKYVQITYKDDESLKYAIVMPTENSMQDDLADKTYAFYTVLNCKSALWFVNEIKDFINVTAVIYKNPNPNDGDKQVFKEKFQNFTNTVLVKLKSFIGILTYFHEIISDTSFYMDIGVLKALISLNMKIDLMSSSFDDDQTSSHSSDRNIVDMLLVEIVAPQRFLSVHCTYGESKDNQVTEMFNVPVFDDDYDVGNGNIDNLLSGTTNIGLASNNSLENCSARQIRLDNIIKMHENEDIISSTILKMTMDKDRNKTDQIQINEIKKQMMKSYDIYLFWWYHDSILLAIMKLMCHMVIEITSEVILSDAEIVKISDINYKINDNKIILPAYFVKGFDVLTRVNNNNNSELLLYYNRLENVSSGFDIEKTKMPEYLNELLTRIDNNFDDIVCAQKYLKYLRTEDAKYYTPGSHNKSTLIIDYTESEEQIYESNSRPTSCSFVKSLYIFSFHVLQDVRNGGTVDLDVISNICMLVIQHETNNWNLIKMAYNIATLLKNLRFRSDDTEINQFLFNRYLDIVIAELGMYRIQYCKTTEYLSIQFHGHENYQSYFLWFMQLVLLNRYEISAMGNFFENDNLRNKIESTSVQYLQIEYLYSNYVENSEVIKLYTNIIKVYWNGQLQSVENIFTDSRAMTFDPQNVYALYDIYNKFFMAVIFHEVKRLTSGDYDSSMENLANMKKGFNYNDYDDAFPDDLTPFKMDFNYFFDLEDLQDKVEAQNDLDRTLSEVVEKFKKSNFVIDYNATIQSSPSNTRFYTTLHTEVVSYVRKFKIDFCKLKRLNF